MSGLLQVLPATGGGQRPSDQTASGNVCHIHLKFIPISLQVRDFLQRVKCGRFPPIEKDMRMVAAHCGSLFLDPAALSQASTVFGLYAIPQ